MVRVHLKIDVRMLDNLYVNTERERERETEVDECTVVGVVARRQCLPFKTKRVTEPWYRITSDSVNRTKIHMTQRRGGGDTKRKRERPE